MPSRNSVWSSAMMTVIFFAGVFVFNERHPNLRRRAIPEQCPSQARFRGFHHVRQPLIIGQALDQFQNLRHVALGRRHDSNVFHR